MGGCEVANHPSALKRERQAGKRRERNRAVASKIKTALKQVRLSLAKNDTEQLKSLLRKATSVIDSAASSGVIPKKRASRKTSRLTRQVNRQVSLS